LAERLSGAIKAIRLRRSLASTASSTSNSRSEGAKKLRVLLVEDEVRMSKLVSRALVRAGFVVDSFGTCADGSEALSSFHYDAAILDLGLPDGDGLTLLTATRSAGYSIPVLVLTARDAIEDRVSGLDAGADDYLVKPFAMSELIARTKALLRRPGSALGTLLIVGNVTFDSIGRDVRIGDAAIAFSRREIAILEHLMRRQGRVVPKTLLEEKLYGIDDELDSNTIPVHVHYLRRRLLDAGATVQIHTVRGVGYLLAELKP
jgi:DNA-binding response OmpR family regulator